jgi:hypothetical protein
VTPAFDLADNPLLTTLNLASSCFNFAQPAAPGRISHLSPQYRSRGKKGCQRRQDSMPFWFSDAPRGL